MKNHTSCYYFPLFICTRLVLSFEYANICSVLISTSLMITKIMNVSVDCKKKKIIHCSVLLEIHVSQSIEFCHCANSFCLEIGISRFFFFDYQLIFFFSHSKKKNLSRELCVGTQWLFQKHAVPPLWQFITRVSLIDCFSLFWYREKNRQSIGHPSNWTPTTNLRTIIQNFD